MVTQDLLGPKDIGLLVELEHAAQRCGGDDESAAQALYEGLFTRIQRTHPLDYYWLWTWEVWQHYDMTPAQIAAIKLETLDAGLDVLTPEQIAYDDDYAAGT